MGFLLDFNTGVGTYGTWTQQSAPTPTTGAAAVLDHRGATARAEVRREAAGGALRGEGRGSKDDPGRR